MKNTLENLELKLAQTRLENSEKLDKFETEYKKEYSDFFDELFKNDILGFKRLVSVNFQLEKLNNPELNNKKILKKSIENALIILPVNKEKKEILENKISKIVLREGFNPLRISELFVDNSDLHKNKNFPILESLEKFDIIDKQDLIKISLKFKETKNFLESISVLENGKKETIKTHYFELNNTKTEDRIDNFKNDFSDEINDSNNIQIYPKVLKFIGKNYFRLKLKNKIESKKDRLKRMFKIAFLKLYRLKYSGIDITSILNQIDSLDDLDSMINLLLKFFEELKQNPHLASDYIVSDEVDEIKEIGIEAEENKEKILFSEKKTLKANEILEKADNKLNEKDLEKLLGDNVDLIGNEFKNRINIEGIDEGIKSEKDNLDDSKNDDEEFEKEVDLEEYYKDLKDEYEKLEKKKIKLFLDGNYDLLDEINNELLDLIIKLEKLEKLLFFYD